MTEAEWLACTDLGQLHRTARPHLTARKKRLLLLGLARRAGHLLNDQRSLAGLDVTERWLDGKASNKELKAARQGSLLAASEAAKVHQATFQTFLSAVSSAGLGDQGIWIMNFMQPVTDPNILSTRSAAHAASAAEQASEAAYMATNHSRSPLGLAEKVYFALRAEVLASGSFADYTAVRGKEEPVLCGLLQDVIGNPFRPIALGAAWLSWNGGTVIKLAQAIYDDRAFDHLPILADALEDAGCHDADILAHCREPDEHVRGCWVVHTLLGKT